MKTPSASVRRSPLDGFQSFMPTSSEYEIHAPSGDQATEPARPIGSRAGVDHEPSSARRAIHAPLSRPELSQVSARPSGDHAAAASSLGPNETCVALPPAIGTTKMS